MRYTIFKTPLCDVILAGDEDGLSYLHLATDDCVRAFEVNPLWERDDVFFADVQKQVEEFLAGERREFSVVLNLQGTKFQREVWAELAKIPYGETRSYKEVAQQLGRPNGARAVGMANSKNPVPLIVPCHRVINADGKLAGFAHGIKTKERLLELEGRKETRQKQAKLDF